MTLCRYDGWSRCCLAAVMFWRSSRTRSPMDWRQPLCPRLSMVQGPCHDLLFSFNFAPLLSSCDDLLRVKLNVWQTDINLITEACDLQLTFNSRVSTVIIVLIIWSTSTNVHMFVAGTIATCPTVRGMTTGRPLVRCAIHWRPPVMCKSRPLLRGQRMDGSTLPPICSSCIDPFHLRCCTSSCLLIVTTGRSNKVAQHCFRSWNSGCSRP